MKFFETQFLEKANAFIAKLDRKSASKVLYNIDLAEHTNDPKLLKKLKGEIWEFRSQYLGNQNRLLAFWDKTDAAATLVVATHGFVKKDNKVPSKEIDKAEVSDWNILITRKENSYGKKGNENVFTCRNERQVYWRSRYTGKRQV